MMTAHPHDEVIKAVHNVAIVPARYPWTTLWLIGSVALTAWNTVAASTTLLAIILVLQLVLSATVVIDRKRFRARGRRKAGRCEDCGRSCTDCIRKSDDP